MERFTVAELADMHFVYGVADGNAVEARRVYEERFPGREVPDRRLFQALHQRLRETGALRVSLHSIIVRSLLNSPWTRWGQGDGGRGR